MINSNEAMIRAHAAWALGEIGIKGDKGFLGESPVSGK